MNFRNFKVGDYVTMKSNKVLQHTSMVVYGGVYRVAQEFCANGLIYLEGKEGPWTMENWDLYNPDFKSFKFGDLVQRICEPDDHRSHEYMKLGGVYKFIRYSDTTKKSSQRTMIILNENGTEDTYDSFRFALANREAHTQFNIKINY